MHRISRLALAAASLWISGCASTYGNLVSGSQLGAHEYQPAVLPQPGMQSRYAEILGLCRQVAANRQVTAAQEAQLRTLTGVTEGSVGGAMAGLQIGTTLKSAGLGISANRTFGIGLLTGLATSAASAFSSGAQHDASETRDVLLTCLRKADPSEQIYRVIE
jgi:hypothetical protein